MNLAHRFSKQIEGYTLSEQRITAARRELSTFYVAENRHYHNLQHLEALFGWFDQYVDQLEDSETISWAIWYHDIIYNARRRDNEEQSALLAEQRLLNFGVPTKQTKLVVKYIRATAQHLEVEATGDLAYFLDFDLAILGSDRADYETYAAAVRKEYAHVPGFLYRRGRKKVLRYFLASERLYRTEELYNLREDRARKNLAWELHN
jgi:predicted metal-dependent HD superfamily phosphohydrolase